MTLNQLIRALEGIQDSLSLNIMLPHGDSVPEHFHVTEVGKVQKDFVDCGGTVRQLKYCVLQVWTAHDVEHRLDSTKLCKILKMSWSIFPYAGDLPVLIEYGENVAAQYVLNEVQTTSTGLLFVLEGKKTDCLAPDKCGIVSCKAGSGCC